MNISMMNQEQARVAQQIKASLFKAAEAMASAGANAYTLADLLDSNMLRTEADRIYLLACEVQVVESYFNQKVQD